ncbi:protein of unassigned function [Methylobacterium oryzae CBMB20]|uniref:Protein of unassigned function n=1 Tax=Methylobacterium oryzae CBMB20 TaxID=693986 RepID=A0A089NVW5_9HYPH|nr:protein of unassigned function [Methylobacterium oryzae CBMB20]
MFIRFHEAVRAQGLQTCEQGQAVATLMKSSIHLFSVSTVAIGARATFNLRQ